MCGEVGDERLYRWKTIGPVRVREPTKRRVTIPSPGGRRNGVRRILVIDEYFSPTTTILSAATCYKRDSSEAVILWRYVISYISVTKGPWIPCFFLRGLTMNGRGLRKEKSRLKIKFCTIKYFDRYFTESLLTIQTTNKSTE